MRLKLLIAVAAAAAAAIASGQTPPPAGSAPELEVARPAYPRATGPRLRIDEAHANHHTLAGRYAAFATLLGNDGYRVAAATAPISAESLAGVDILVVANARGAERGTSAFAPAEIAALHVWVEQGGALLLIAYHSPFSDAAAELGRAFGVNFRSGFVLNPGQRNQDVFRRDSGLADHVITRGAGGDPAVAAVRTFTGTAFDAPGAEALITLGRGFVVVTPGGGGRMRLADIPQQSAEGLLQGAALAVGRGRLVVIGEAAMLTTQNLDNVPGAEALGTVGLAAEQNRQFLLNLMHWLSRRPGY